MARRIALDGLGTVQLLADDTLHRFAVGDEDGKSGWYIVHTDGIPCGWYGNWKIDLKQKITALDEDVVSKSPKKAVKTASQEEVNKMVAWLAEAKRQAEERRQAEAEQAAQWSAAFYEKAGQPDPDHPYLLTKCVKPTPELRQSGGELIVPIYNPDGRIVGVQRIFENGKKIFAKGFAKKGNFGVIDGDESTILICEGFATGVSLHTATGCRVILALDCGNLASVVPNVKTKWPKSRIVVCGDDDIWSEQNGKKKNPGRTCAEQAASLAGVQCVFPQFKSLAERPTDFNDLQVIEGIDAVREQLRGAVSSGQSTVPQIASYGMDCYLGPAPKQEWLVSGLLPLGVPALFCAAGGTGKGMLTLDLGLRVAGGTSGRIDFDDKWLGARVCSHGSVVILTAEDTQDEIHRRLEALDPTGDRRRAANGRLHIIPLPDVNGPITLIRAKEGYQRGYEMTPECIALIDQLKKIPDLKLINIDPLASFVAVDVNADPQAAQFVQGVFALISKVTNALVLVAHHMGKSNPAKGKDVSAARAGVRGSTALVDGVRIVLALWGADESTIKELEAQRGHSLNPADVCMAAIVKANCLVDTRIRRLLRGKDGLLRAVTDSGVISMDEQRKLLAKTIGDFAAAGNPFTISGRNAPVNRLEDLPRELRRCPKRQIGRLLKDLLDNGDVVRCTYKQRQGAFLDVNGGNFATIGNTSDKADKREKPEIKEGSVRPERN